jgi:4'-phosphopantetheinyl transferase
VRSCCTGTVAWDAPPSAVRLAPETLHLWRARLSDFAGTQNSLATLLSDTEAARAARYKFPEPRERFTVGRAVLRWILSRYVNVAPDQLHLTQEAHGKPYLAHPAQGWLQFNLAHTDTLILCLVGSGRAVGVDVEMARPIIGMNRLASLLFTGDQRHIFDGLAEGARLEPLLSMWTSMEALGKATGLGLASALTTFHVEVDPVTGMPVPEQVCCGSMGCYAVRPLELAEGTCPEPVEGHVAALAVEVPGNASQADQGSLVPTPEGYVVSPQDVLAACAT